MIRERSVLEPLVPTTEHVDSFGKLCQRMKIPEGDMTIEVEMVMLTEDTIAAAPGAEALSLEALPFDVLQYLEFGWDGRGLSLQAP